MPKLTPLSAKDIIKKLKTLGFQGPMYGGKDIGIGLQSDIISLDLQ